MKFRIAAFLLVGLLLGGLLGWLIIKGSRGAGTGERRLPPTVGSAAPDFELAGLDGKTFHLSSLRGSPVIINFWATWCPPCKQEMPLIERYSQKYAGKLLILGVDNAEEAKAVQPFITGMGITYPILLDQTGNVSEKYFVKDFPATFFVDSDGMLRGQHLGILSEDQLVQYLQTIGIEP